ncbi:Sec-independent protein translocase protein TATA, chloroplastic [Apostasia shenzhenica]|uniref:Sec-independent protein translocase protein TATA, chloroplastic n=1 Tax=Apostasia shenzhenica TaxID=1088818 RepID=A0A2I0BCN3_9ASPA|nr:Sec-independent protein translocase protein TATA, chloroplastic [Apostasia shenzhenica]
MASLMVSSSWICPAPRRPSHVPLASSTSVFLSSGGRALHHPALLSLPFRRRRAVGGGRSRGLDCRCLFGLGVPELVVIAGVAALVFGPKKLPEIGRSIGKTVKSFQQAAKEFESELKWPEQGSQPPIPPENLTAAKNEEEKKELEESGTKETN